MCSFSPENIWPFDPVLSLYLLLDMFRLPLKALFFEQEKRARFFYLAPVFWTGCWAAVDG